jgi:hypothetical protein
MRKWRNKSKRNLTRTEWGQTQPLCSPLPQRVRAPATVLARGRRFLASMCRGPAGACLTAHTGFSRSAAEAWAVRSRFPPWRGAARAPLPAGMPLTRRRGASQKRCPGRCQECRAPSSWATPQCPSRGPRTGCRRQPLTDLRYRPHPAPARRVGRFRGGGRGGEAVRPQKGDQRTHLLELAGADGVAVAGPVEWRKLHQGRAPVAGC